MGEQKWEVKGLVGQCALLSCRPVSEDLQQANCPGRVDTSKRITHINTYTRVYTYTYRNTYYTLYNHTIIFVHEGSSTIILFPGRLDTFLNLYCSGWRTIYSATCFRCRTHVHTCASKLRLPAQPSGVGQLNMQGVYLGALVHVPSPCLVQMVQRILWWVELWCKAACHRG